MDAGCLSIFRAPVVNGEPYNAKNRKGTEEKNRREVILMRGNDLLLLLLSSDESCLSLPPLTPLSAISLLRQRKFPRRRGYGDRRPRLLGVPSWARRRRGIAEKSFRIEGNSMRTHGYIQGVRRQPRQSSTTGRTGRTK